MLASPLEASSFLLPLAEFLLNFLLHCSGEYDNRRCLPFRGRVISGDVLSPSTELAGELATEDVLCSLLRELLMENCCCIPLPELDDVAVVVVDRGDRRESFLRRFCCFDSSLADLRRVGVGGVLAPVGLSSSPQSDLDTKCKKYYHSISTQPCQLASWGMKGLTHKCDHGNIA